MLQPKCYVTEPTGLENRKKKVVIFTPLTWWEVCTPSPQGRPMLVRIQWLYFTTGGSTNNSFSNKVRAGGCDGRWHFNSKTEKISLLLLGRKNLVNKTLISITKINFQIHLRFYNFFCVITQLHCVKLRKMTHVNHYVTIT